MYYGDYYWWDGDGVFIVNHISREQAEEIAREVLEAVGKNPAESGLVVMTYLEFQASLNYAIDEVIGEPVGWKANTGFGVRFQETLEDKFKIIEWDGKPMWEPLYALKQVKP